MTQAIGFRLQKGQPRSKRITKKQHPPVQTNASNSQGSSSLLLNDMTMHVSLQAFPIFEGSLTAFNRLDEVNRILNDNSDPFPDTGHLISTNTTTTGKFNYHRSIGINSVLPTRAMSNEEETSILRQPNNNLASYDPTISLNTFEPTKTNSVLKVGHNSSETTLTATPISEIHFDSCASISPSILELNNSTLLLLENTDEFGLHTSNLMNCKEESKTAPTTRNDHQTSSLNTSNRTITPPTTPRGLNHLEQLTTDKQLMAVIENCHKRGNHRCAHCPRRFRTLYEYAAHLDEYSIVREFKCPFKTCPWHILGFPRRSDLRRHCANQHKENLTGQLKNKLNLKDGAYETKNCPNKYCPKKFNRNDAFARHVAISHESVNSRFNRKLTKLLKECPEFDSEEARVEYIRGHFENDE
ncbi:hypothetical protein NCAS_0A02160 [Naumovozyma castellii]|uniref:C2H2-type domain-containing protein n=1 Tax=Naumovozyma castellii TaxID=27288 RepID=G0V5N6_NAUCA|nr:hypothetical protein NCAS_0A02160 [Naumovozyma castellii CBS 4309]CCC66774.1 hypothetical protein NCAS_0A02160 [Naumovozyma castellii CBS 4309]